MTTAVEKAHTDQQAPITPDAIMQLGFAFWGSRTLASAIELGVFSELALAGPLGADELRARTGVHRRGARDLFDALVALGLLERDEAGYCNAPAAEAFLDPAKPGYVGAFLEMAGNRRTWHTLSDALRTGAPQIEANADEDDFFEAVYADREKLGGFLRAMTANSAGTARVLATAFPWDRHETVIDVGCAEGCLPVQLALAHDHLSGGGFDLPAVRPFFEAFTERAGVADRMRFHAGDFLADDLPAADALVMGHVLHDWDLERKRMLIEKAHAALPTGGALIVYETLIDDDRRHNAFGLLMSLNMLVETRGGFDYTGVECQGWMAGAGFSDTYVRHLAGPVSMVVALK